MKPSSKRDVTPRVRRAGAMTGALILAAGLLSGCHSGGGDSTKSGSSGGPDVSVAGQVTYGCQLANHVKKQGPPDRWMKRSGLTLAQAYAAPMMIGAGNPQIARTRTGQDYSEVEGLSSAQAKLMPAAQQLRNAFTTLRLKAAQRGVEGLVKGCTDLGEIAPKNAADVSDEGMAHYACKLTDRLISKGGVTESGTADQRNRTDPRTQEAWALSALLGAGSYSLKGHKELSEGARRLVTELGGAYSADPDQSLDSALKDIEGKCADDDL